MIYYIMHIIQMNNDRHKSKLFIIMHFGYNVIKLVTFLGRTLIKESKGGKHMVFNFDVKW